MSATAIVVHAASIDWESKAQDLDTRGWALLPKLITQDQCRQTSALYARDAAFRSRVVMSRHGVSTLGTDCKRMARTDGNRRPISPGSF